MNYPKAGTRLCAAIVFLLAPFLGANAAEPIWRNAWAAPAPFSLTAATYGGGIAGPATQFEASATGGDIVLATPAFAKDEYVVVRMTGDGSIRWSSHLPEQFAATVVSLIANDDGGAYVATRSAGFEGHVTRIGADGIVIWSLPIFATSLTLAPSGQLIATDDKQVLQLDPTAGTVVWQRSISNLSAITVGADSSIYVCAYSPPLFMQFLIRLDSLGRPLWSVQGPGMIAGGDGLVYGIVDTRIEAYRAADGARAWSTELSPNVFGQLWVSGGEPIFVGASAAYRYAASDGHLLWTQSYGPDAYAVITGSTLIAQWTGHWSAIDAQSGALRWSQPRPATDTDGNRLDFVGFTEYSTNRILAVGRSETDNAHPATLLPIDAASGALQSPLPTPSIDQSVTATQWQLPSGDVVAAALAVADPAQPLLFKRIDANGGGTRWQSTHLWHDPLSEFGTAFTLRGAAREDTSALMLAYSGTSNGGGLSSVTLVDNASGAVRWTRFLRPSETYAQGFVDASAPAFDQAGNVFVSVAAEVICHDLDPSAPQCTTYSLYKLDAADGHVLWRIDRPLYAYLPYISPPPFVIVGNDAYLVGNLRGSDSPVTLARESGVDGSDVWSSDLLADDGVWAVYAGPDGNPILFGNGWGKLDALTGATLWSQSVPSDYPTNCIYCNLRDVLVARNGDLFAAEVFQATTRIDHLHGDGSDVRSAVVMEPNDPALISYPMRVAQSSNDALWLAVGLRPVGKNFGLGSLAQFEPDQPTFASNQALYANSPETPHGNDFASLLAAPEDNRLLIAAARQRPGDAPQVTVEAVDTTIAAHGNLSVTLDLNRTHVSAGELLGIHARVTYAGDAPVRGVAIVVYPPWASGMTMATCTVSSAAQCNVDTRFGSLYATVDVEPGAAIDLSANVRVLDTYDETQPVLARVNGPIELDESNLVDNFAHAGTIASLFSNGFEVP